MKKLITAAVCLSLTNPVLADWSEVSQLAGNVASLAYDVASTDISNGYDSIVDSYTEYTKPQPTQPPTSSHQSGYTAAEIVVGTLIIAGYTVVVGVATVGTVILVVGAIKYIAIPVALAAGVGYVVVSTWRV